MTSYQQAWRAGFVLAAFLLFAWSAGGILDAQFQQLAPHGAHKMNLTLPKITDWCVRNLEGTNYAFGGAEKLLLVPWSFAGVLAVLAWSSNPDSLLQRLLPLAFALFAIDATLAAVLTWAAILPHTSILSLWIDDRRPLTHAQRGLLFLHIVCAVVVVVAVVGAQVRKRRHKKGTS